MVIALFGKPSEAVRRAGKKLAGLLSTCLACGLLTGALCGCAFQYEDEAGVRHVFGLVDLAVEKPAEHNIAGDIVQVSTFGVSILTSAETSSFAIGYNKITTAAFLNNSVALGPFDQRALRCYTCAAEESHK